MRRWLNWFIHCFNLLFFIICANVCFHLASRCVFGLHSTFFFNVSFFDSPSANVSLFLRNTGYLNMFVSLFLCIWCRLRWIFFEWEFTNYVFKWSVFINTLWCKVVKLLSLRWYHLRGLCSNVYCYFYFLSSNLLLNYLFKWYTSF